MTGGERHSPLLPGGQCKGTYGRGIFTLGYNARILQRALHSAVIGNE